MKKFDRIPEHMMQDVRNIINQYESMAKNPEAFTKHAWRETAHTAVRLLKDLQETNRIEPLTEEDAVAIRYVWSRFKDFHEFEIGELYGEAKEKARHVGVFLNRMGV